MDFFCLISWLTGYHWFQSWREKRRLKCTIMINKPNIMIKGRIQNPERNLYRIISFLGIPYALPPVDELRFQPPEPLSEDVMRLNFPVWKAYNHPKCCIQFDEDCNVIKGSENCLYLNIYIPNKPKHNTELLPVLVYIHGGGFTKGPAVNVEMDDLVGKEKCVCVTVQYRLDAFGFLNMRSPNCRGNAGLKDQVMALRWIRDNIEPFGGDPGRVTIYGESAGATCVNLHMVSPLSKGLFHRAIVQSGGIYCPWGYGGHARSIKQLFKRGCGMENELRSVVVESFKDQTAKEFLKYSENIKLESLRLHPGKITVLLKPSVECIKDEGAFLPEPIENLMSAAEPVPTIAGITRQEGYMAFRGNAEDQPVLIVKNDGEFFTFLKHNFNWTDASVNKNFDLVRNLYFPNLEELSDDQIIQNFAMLITDIFFRRFYDNFKIGNLLQPGSPSLYIYLFDYFSGVRIVRGIHDPDFEPKASEHGDDMRYLLEKTAVFNSLNCFEGIEERLEKLNQMQTVMENMSKLWASFCKEGTPRCLEKDVNWIPHTERSPCYLRIRERLSMQKGLLNQQRWRLLNSICRDSEEVESTASSAGTPSRSETPEE